MILAPYTIPIQKTYANGTKKLIGVKKIKWFSTPMSTIVVTRHGQYQSISYEAFSPGSRDNIIQWMEEDYNFVFPYYTKNGNKKADVESLEEMEHPSGQLLKRYLKVIKDQSQIGGEKGGWLRYFNPATHSIHHRVDLIGATTHRATHSKPNLAQVSKDKRHREVFCAPPGMVMVGADLKNIEIRVLAHYLAPYDGGKYANIALSKDLHFYHAKLAGFWTLDDREWDEKTATKDMKTARTASKSFFFGYLYGQGSSIRGNILTSKLEIHWTNTTTTETGIELKPNAPHLLLSFTTKEYTTAKKKIEKRLVTIGDTKYFPLRKNQYVLYTERLVYETIYGEQVANTFLKNLTGINELIKDCQKQSKEKGSITAIDGRELTSRSPHSALNLLLQGSAGIIAKKWMVNYHSLANSVGFKHGGLWVQNAFVHDEYQCSVVIPFANKLGNIMVEGCNMIQEQFNMNIRIEADFSVGHSWAETH